MRARNVLANTMVAAGTLVSLYCLNQYFEHSGSAVQIAAESDTVVQASSEQAAADSFVVGSLGSFSVAWAGCVLLVHGRKSQ